MTAAPISPAVVERSVAPPALAVEVKRLTKIYRAEGKRPGVTALAGYLAGRTQPGGRSGVLICGGNIDLGW